MFQYLSCPRCGSNNLHQIRVEVGFRREEDEPESTIVTVNKGGFETRLGRIADRRDDLRITFSCESCDTDDDWLEAEGKLELRIWQHKGTTYMEWVGMGESVKLTDQ